MGIIVPDHFPLSSLANTDERAVVEALRDHLSDDWFVVLDTARTLDGLVEAGERVFTHCAYAEHRAPTLATAYLMVRGVDAATAQQQVMSALGGGPVGFLTDAVDAIGRLPALCRAKRPM